MTIRVCVHEECLSRRVCVHEECGVCVYTSVCALGVCV